MYLVAALNWFSRYVLAWQLSNTLDGVFCLEALQLALGPRHARDLEYGSRCAVYGLELHQLSGGCSHPRQHGRAGRALDNIFIERFWRSVKYEDLYLKDYASVPELENGLGGYFHFYNHIRPHQSLRYRTPAEVHFA